MPYADIIILALIAGFILLRLRNVLGQNTGHDSSDFMKRLQQPMEQAKEPIVQLADKIKPKPKEELDPCFAAITNPILSQALTNVKTKDQQFNATHFLEGAKVAFEMVFEAFAKGDKQTLKSLLAEEPLAAFGKDIDVRAGQQNKRETTLVSVVSKEIVGAELSGNVARVAVKFVSEQIVVVRDSKGNIVEGDPAETQNVEDEWTFERDLTSKNPNWKIVET